MTSRKQRIQANKNRHLCASVNSCRKLSLSGKKIFNMQPLYMDNISNLDFNRMLFNTSRKKRGTRRTNSMEKTL